MKIFYQNFFSKQKGFSLLEVLIATLVIAGTIMGSMKLQVESMRLSQSSRSDVVAMQLAQKLMDNISMSGQPNSYWNLKNNDFPRSGFLSNWLKELNSLIPNSKANIKCSDESSLCTIEISWLTQSGIRRDSQYVVRN
ncbi:MAG: prepilin-type N-terminal cleavage/methylation domain-containing protein [Pseudomonadota bacterium]